MTSAFLCHCNHIAVPAVIEGNTVLVCRHLLQGSQYRTDPHHVPCVYKSEDTTTEFHPTVRAAVLYRKPPPFKALGPPPGSGLLDLYRPKNEVAVNNITHNRTYPVGDAMDVDLDGELPDGAQFVLGEQRPPMDIHAWQKRCAILEQQLQESEAERIKLKQRMAEQEEEMRRKIRTAEEQCRGRVRAKEGEVEDYRKKFENARQELHDLRRSTRSIVSSALEPHRTSSPSSI